MSRKLVAIQGKLKTLKALARQAYNEVLIKVHAWVVGAVRINKEPFDASKRIRVAFILSFDFEWDCLASVYTALSGMKAVCITVFVEEELLQRDYARDNDRLEFRRITPVALSKRAFGVYSPHILFIVDPVSFAHNWWLRIARARIIYIPYGISVSGAKYSKKAQYNQWVHQNAWKIFGPGKFYEELYWKFCANGGSHVHSLGYPKHEALLNSKFELQSSRIYKSKKKTFLWNIQFRRALWSTWESYGSQILELFSKRNDSILICRPHPFFFDWFDDIKEAARVRKMIVNNKNTLLDESPSMSESFSKSNALLTDGSSVVYDYWWSFKPMLYLRTKQSELLHEHAFTLIKNYHYIADCPEVINWFIELVCSGTDPKQKLRESLNTDLVGIVHPEGSGKRVAEFVVAEMRASLDSPY